RVWQSNRGGSLFVQNSGGPIVMNGVVVAGSTCQVAGFGCYVTGHNVTDGEEVWRNETIPRAGQPGYDTWGGAPFDKRWMTGVWAFSLTIPISTSFITDRAEPVPLRRHNAEQSVGLWRAPTHALRSSPRRGKLSGSTKPCRATIGTRNARSK